MATENTLKEIIDDRDMNELTQKAISLVEYSRNAAVKQIDKLQIMTYFMIGGWIVEIQQDGKRRAKYGKQIIARLSKDLTNRFGKGFSPDTLEKMRKFYLVYRNRISAPSLQKFDLPKSAPVVRILEEFPFSLSWTHYLILMRIENVEEREFYEREATIQNWGKRELSRQYASSLYERLLLSRNKDEVLKISQKGQLVEKPDDIVKDPYVLEFLGLKEDSSYSENELETRIINHLQDFLMEMGKGFTFVGRQVRFTFDEDHFRVDLVLYNRLLRCFVLIDLKNGKLKHQDLGQMQMYVNYYDRYEKTEDENPTIGILLCSEKNDNMVELTLPKDANIYASKYELYLPDKKLLQKKLQEWINEESGE